MVDTGCGPRQGGSQQTSGLSSDPGPSVHTCKGVGREDGPAGRVSIAPVYSNWITQGGKLGAGLWSGTGVGCVSRLHELRPIGNGSQ